MGLGRGGDTTAERHAPSRQCAGVSVVHGVVTRRAQADQIPRRPGQLRPVLCGPGVMHHRGVDRQAVAAALPALVAIPPQGSTTCGRPALRLVIHGPRPWRSAPGLSPPADEKKRLGHDTPSRVSLGSGAGHVTRAQALCLSRSPGGSVCNTGGDFWRTLSAGPAGVCPCRTVGT